jgi:hypothetical protein
MDIRVSNQELADRIDVSEVISNTIICNGIFSIAGCSGAVAIRQVVHYELASIGRFCSCGVQGLDRLQISPHQWHLGGGISIEQSMKRVCVIIWKKELTAKGKMVLLPRRLLPQGESLSRKGWLRHKLLTSIRHFCRAGIRSKGSQTTLQC